LDEAICVALSAIPELFQMSFAWTASRGALTLIPSNGRDALRLSPGDAFPDISLPTVDGDALSFASLLGRKTVLLTWACW
jgi:hypothetical protein